MSTKNDTTPVQFRGIPVLPPGYRAGDDGSIWSCRNNAGMVTPEWHRLIGTITGGYRRFCISVGGKNRYYTAHRLILETFLGPAPPGMECRHLDGNRLNNSPDNLAWGTKKENSADRIRHGTIPRGVSQHKSKLDDLGVLEIWRLREAGFSQQTIASEFGVAQTTISWILRGKGWTHVKPDRVSQFT